MTPTRATCGHGAAFRRGVCRTCYRKLGGAGLPMGTDGRVTSYLRQIAEGTRVRTDSGQWVTRRERK